MIKKILFILFILSITFNAYANRNIQDNHKIIYHVINSDGNHVGSETIALAIQKVSNGYWYDFNDDTFKESNWTSKTTNLSEDVTNGFYHYIFNPPVSETIAEQYLFMVDNASEIYGDHQSELVSYQNIGTSVLTAQLAWEYGTRILTALDEDDTLIDINATTIGTVSNVGDKTGYSLTQTFPTNFEDLAITDTTGLVSVGTNNDKSGYSLTQSFPTNFSSLAITDAGAITAGTVNDKSGYNLSSSGIDAIWDENQSGHTSAGTFGKYLDGQISAISASISESDKEDLIDRVWDELLSGHTVSGSTGDYLNDIYDATDGNMEEGDFTGIEKLIQYYNIGP